MKTISQIESELKLGAYDLFLKKLYGEETQALSKAQNRVSTVLSRFRSTFDEGRPAALFSGPGRTEIGGNHTDHQHGRVLCGSVDMDMLACAAPNGLPLVRIQSEGYPELKVDLDDLSVNIGEMGTSAALVRGIAARLAEMGFRPEGFDACVSSTVLSGSGLSSSAAYEVLIGNIFNTFFCEKMVSAVEIAKIGQYAENAYFGKPCGLMDQMGASLGGAVAIDFADQTNPKLEQINYSFTESGHCLCIVDTGSDHADLTADYAAVTREMKSIAAYFGKEYLRDVPESEFSSAIPALRQSCGDRAVLRAKHFFAEDCRAVQEAKALNAGNFDRFLALVNASGFSSVCDLQNIWSPAHPERQAVSLALSLGRDLLDGAGAIRVHGGGFAGTIQAFVPNNKVLLFKSGMEAVFGKDKCHVLHIRPVGGCVISEYGE